MRLVIVVLVSIIYSVGVADAHSFNVTMIIPAGTEEQASQAFLLASAERDGHPNETSDGHLGGVDANIRFVEVRGDANYNIAETIMSKPDIIVLISQGNWPNDIVFKQIWGFALDELPARAIREFLLAPVPFERRFQQEFGRSAGSIATLTYVAARLIDIAVRKQDGVEDINALKFAIAGY
ncbi:MAG: hypothetical protein ACU0DI_03185 [Paracoccaceae bacterium]